MNRQRLTYPNHGQRRASSSQRGYGSRWQKARRSYLAKHRFCVECNNLADVVDHKVPHKNNQQLFWDRDNWQPMCSRCHNSKTARFDRSDSKGRAPGCEADGMPIDPNHPWNR